MFPPSARLDGLACLKPLQQGDLSNLCGLYWVLNAIQLSNWSAPPTSDQLRELLALGLRHLVKRRVLARVISSGMEQDVWLEMAAKLIMQSNDLLRATLKLRPLRPGSGEYTTTTSVKLIRGAIAGGQPVLCGLGGALDHYTVVAGYSQTRLILLDSTGLRWIYACNFGATKASGKRHWLLENSAQAVVDDW